MNRENPSSPSSALPEPEKELTPEELREKFRDPSYLPTHAEILRAFKPERFFSHEWWAYCSDKNHPIFEFLNEEFLNALSHYLSERAESLGAKEGSPITLLEVGAGSGRLSHFLQQKLKISCPGKINIIATDSGEWNIKTSFPVKKMSHHKALTKYKPDIVIFSWMPYREDCTNDFRACENINEYILIGETDGGCCGDEWRTWGWQSFTERENGEEEKVAPYIADGFERIDLDEIGKQQICRTDRPGDYRHSTTVSFRRKR